MPGTRRLSDGQIMFVTDNPQIAQRFRDYFDSRYGYKSSGVFYRVFIKNRSDEAIGICSRNLPFVVVLDEKLPGTTAYELAKELSRSLGGNRAHVSLIFLIEKESLSTDKTEPTDLGMGCHYVAKPFEVKEIEKIIQDISRRRSIHPYKNPTTHLPSGRLVSDKLRSLVGKRDWALLYVTTDNLDALMDVHGFLIGERVIRFLADLIEETIEEYGAPDDFIGHISEDKFIVVTQLDKFESIAQRLEAQFAEKIQEFCLPDATQSSLVTLSVSTLDGNTAFATFEEINNHILQMIKH